MSSITLQTSQHVLPQDGQSQHESSWGASDLIARACNSAQRTVGLPLR